MRRVTLTVRGGPMEGARREVQLGRLVLGRNPGADGYLLTGDVQVSRRHGELVEERGRVVYRNLSPNGSRVDGEPESGDRVLAPGAVLELGAHRVEVRFEPSPADRQTAAAAGGLWSSGPLARPAVRIALAAYFVALAGLVTAATLGGGRDLSTLWNEARESYRTEYRSGELEAEERAARLDEADRLFHRLLALERSERWDEARAVCRRLMAIDGDAASPLYRFAARRLGTLAGER